MRFSPVLRVAFRCASLFSLVCYASGLGAQTMSPTVANLNYVPDGAVYHQLDVYVPAGLTGRAPLVVHIHGGGWWGGSKGEARTYCDSLYYAGYVIADINYRLSTDSMWPAQIYDCKTAIRFLKANAARYHIDTAHVGLMGESAGGHLAAMVGVTCGVDSLEGRHLGGPRITSRVHAVFDQWGPTDLSKFDGQWPHTGADSCTAWLPYEGNALNPVNFLLGCQVSACPERARTADPIAYIRGGEPPFAIYHGLFDCIVPPIQSQMLYDTLRAFGDSATVEFIPHIQHSDAYFQQPAFRHTIRAFFDSTLRTSSRAVVAECIPRVGDFNCAPNPFREATHMTLPSGRGELCIEDLMGRVVMQLALNNEPYAERSDVLVGSGLPPGVYAVRWISATGVRRMLIVKSVR